MSAAPEIDRAQMDKLLAGVQIPPQPTLLMQIEEECNKPAPDLKKVSTIITHDVGLAAAVLKTVNSPFYGLTRKIDSIQRATALLGLSNILNLVRSALMRNMFSGDGVTLERFWDTANDVANASMFLANRFGLPNPDEYYTLGLFHDCGIAVLAQKHADYKQTLKTANADLTRPPTALEDERYSTNHAVVGYYMARSWHLPAHLTNVIQRHHDYDNMFTNDTGREHESQMMAILKLAGHCSHTQRRLSEDPEWDLIGGAVLKQLGLEPLEYEDLKEDVVTALSA